MTAEAEHTGARHWGRLLLRASMLVATIIGLVAFSVVLAHVTLTPSPASEDLVTTNLRPGRSLRQYAEDYTFLAACKQAGGNLLLGAPFGVLLPILVARRLRMIRMILLTVAVMVIVELVQGALVAGRAFDVDDVILNTTGALLGYLLVGRRISHRYHTLNEGPRAAAPAAGPDTSKANAGGEDKAKAGTKAKAGIKPRPRTKAKAGTKAGAGTTVTDRIKAKAGIRSKNGMKGKSGTTPRAKPRKPGAGAREGRSVSAPARVRELFTRIRDRRPGKDGGAPRPGRSRR